MVSCARATIASSPPLHVRILYLADIRFPLERANGIQTIETCHALAGRGHEVNLLVRPDTVRPPRDPWAFFDLAPCPRLRVQRAAVWGPAPLRRLAYLTRASLASAAARSRADVVYTRDLGVASVVLRLPRQVRPPLVYESHGFAPVFAETRPDLLSGAAAASPAKLRRLSAREARVWRLAEGYVTITEGLAVELAHRFGPRAALATIPDGTRLDPQRRFVPPVRAGSPTAVYVGHLYPWKGVDVLLGALARLPDVGGSIVGGHPAEADLQRLQAQARALGLQDRVEFTGLVPRREVASFLARADVLVMPHTATPVSERYASPLKLFEYLAAGKPIVASDLPAVREVLRDGENACLVRPGDPGALAVGLERVLQDGHLAERIARGAFDAAAAYSWDRRAERLDALLDALVAS
jgi:glycosyltransferase involved in cell wall biosynthesis